MSLPSAADVLSPRDAGAALPPSVEAAELLLLLLLSLLPVALFIWGVASLLLGCLLAAVVSCTQGALDVPSLLAPFLQPWLSWDRNGAAAGVAGMLVAVSALGRDAACSTLMLPAGLSAVAAGAAGRACAGAVAVSSATLVGVAALAAGTLVSLSPAAATAGSCCWAAGADVFVAADAGSGLAAPSPGVDTTSSAIVAAIAAVAASTALASAANAAAEASAAASAAF